MLEEMRSLRKEVELLRKDMAIATSEWVDPDDACRIIGVPITESGSHRRRLGKLVEFGRLTQFRDGKPRMYNRDELRKVAQMVLLGKIKV